jgi:eukaryotic-like serine/threonine-protein kinase
VDISEQYKIIRELGNQSKRKFGRVFLVEDKSTGMLFVLKAIGRSSDNPHLSERLIRESDFSFDHGALPQVVSFKQDPEENLLVLVYKPGITIDEFWKNVPKKERISTLKKIVNALLPLFEMLRSQQIVHGDIKPSNLLIDLQGDQLKVYLLDFGLALRLNKRESERKILFPLGFASPEQVLNQVSAIDHTSDLFSLGILIWKLFAGKLPLVHPNPSVFTNLQITHPLPEHDAIPKDLFRILAKMCHKHQFLTAPNRMEPTEVSEALKSACSERYQTLDEVLVDLNDLSDKRSWLSRVLS